MDLDIVKPYKVIYIFVTQCQMSILELNLLFYAKIKYPDQVSPRGGGGGGYSDFHTYVGAVIFFFGGGGQNFEFQILLGVSNKLVLFWGMTILWIFLGGHHKIGLY